MAEKRPNILMFMTDHQRADALGCAGHPVLKTPAIDRLAGEGMRFTHSFTCASACMPSRAALWSGLYPHVNGVVRTDWKSWLSPATPTIQSLLSGAGYLTVAVGKMHFVPWGTLGGFQHRVIIESKYSTAEDEYHRALRERGFWGKHIGHHTPGFGKAYKAMPSPLPEEYHIDGYIGRRGVETLRAIRAEPFFLVVSFCGPHDPYDPPEPYASRYDSAAMPKPVARPGEAASFPPVIRDVALSYGLERLDFTRMTPDDIGRVRALYYGNLSLIDRWIGNLLETLDELGLSERTLVAHTCDHGDYIGNHQLLFKHGPGCDDETRVPLLIRWPGRIPPQANDAFVENVDLMPTYLEAAGLKPPPQCQGRSLFDLLDGRGEPWRDAVVTHLEGRGVCYRDRHWKYTRFPGQPFDVMYNLQADPNELRNLCHFQDRGWVDRAADLSAKLVAWYYQHPAQTATTGYGGYGGLNLPK
ncbi:MAG: sulfatase-like hydrolase/transferase [Verrucomicrobia bacterium]|nr:sulfatase-like hydrolase/transferase [Verrucomicrobiota bacterium]